MTLKEKKSSIQILEKFGFVKNRGNDYSFLYYYNDIEIMYSYFQRNSKDIYIFKIDIFFPAGFEIRFGELFYVESIDPKAILNFVKKMAAAVKFIEL
jgi:hypothetical protein